jgi:PEGA domain-containing protein
MRMFTQLLLAAGLMIAGNLFAADATNAPLRKVAIIVENHAGAQFNDKVSVLEDLLGNQIAGRGYSVISRDVVTSALSGQSNALDSALNDNTSALRLAQNLGADFILIPSLTSYGIQRKAYTGDVIATINVTHVLRVSYKIVEAGAGGAIKGDTVTATKSIRQSASLLVEDTDTINGLLADAAGQLADAIAQNANSLPSEVAKDKKVSFGIACTMSDPRQQPILVSAVGISPDNRVIVTNQPIAIQPMDVTVELDGVAIGSAPGVFQAQPGLHKLRLSREGFDTWERTVNVYDGQNMRIALQMSANGYARWMETTGFLSALDNKRKLTDAEVKKVEGIAKFFSESHYRVDTKENLKIYNSLY